MRRVRGGRGRYPAIILSLLTLVSLVAVGARVPATTSVAASGTPRVTSSADRAMQKLHPQLRASMATTPDAMVTVHAYVTAGTDLSRYMPHSVARAWVDPLGNTSVTGQVQARDLIKVASLVNVHLVMPMGGVFAPAVDADTQVAQGGTLPDAETQAKMRAHIQSRAGARAGYTIGSASPDATTVEPDGWADVLNNHNSVLAWEKGYTGVGVKAMVNDSGIDFAHPDLLGTQARITDPSSPYYGWPEQFDQTGMLQLAYDAYLGTTNFADGNTEGFANTTTVITEANPVYQPLDASEAHTYILTGTSQSGNYHIGTHPDYGLYDWYYIITGANPEEDDGERPAILVIDEAEAGVYDTVIADLNYNFDFTDDKPARKGNEVLAADYWGAFDPALGDFAPEPDGFYDQSGGLVFWIADGMNPVPGMDWYWGIGAAGNGAQDEGEQGAGDLVAFAYNHFATSPAGNHGQLVASNIAGQGRTNADSFESIFGTTELDRDTGGIAPPYKPADTTGMVTGAGLDVQLVDAGDFYSYGWIDAFVFAALGTDGVPGTGDDVQLMNNSWGYTAVNSGWDGFSRLVELYTVALNPKFLPVISTGNSGPGYGTNGGPAAPSALDVGASTMYGSTGWDSASGADQITYGDVASFSSRGPTRLGDQFTDVLASGNRAAGAEPLNMTFNGPHAWITWGGTSRSAPVAVGNAALMYQAYYEHYGEWPDQDVAKAIIMSGAEDLGYDSFTMGAGMVDGNRSVDIAAGITGFYVTPSQWVPGDLEGEVYPGAAKVLQRGESDELALEIHNTTDRAMAVTVGDRWLEWQNRWQTEWTSSPVTEEDLVLHDEDGAPIDTVFDWNKPHYLWNVTDLIPQGTDVVSFRQNFPFEQFSPDLSYDGTMVNDWYLLAYDWKDVNGDGNLWEDLDGNGTVNEGEIDPGEYVRMDYSNQRDNAGFLTLQHPQERVHDGLFVALIHNQARADVPQTTMTLTLDFYQQVDFPWVDVYEDEVHIAPNGTGRAQVRVDIPGDAPIGVYEGALWVNDGYWTSIVPVTINVAARDARIDNSTDPADTLYQNYRFYGGIDWIGDTETGDWRYYYAELPESIGGMPPMPEGQQFWLTDIAWSDLPTDVNAHILSPVVDEFSDPEEGAPDYFGPYTLEEVAASNEGYNGDGVYLIQTSSGGSREILGAPYMPGLNQLVLQNVNFEGDDEEPTTEEFQVRTGGFGVSVSPIDVTAGASGEVVTVNEQIVSTMALSGLVADGFGLSQPQVDSGLVIQQDDPDDPTTSSYTRELVLEHAGLLEIDVDGLDDRDDLDLYVTYDFNGDGEHTLDELIAQSATSAADESIRITLPADGSYKIWVHGWAVPDGESAFALTVLAVQGHDITVTDLPEGGIDPYVVYDVTVNIDGRDLAAGDYTGIVTLGPPEGPSAVIMFVYYRVE